MWSRHGQATESFLGHGSVRSDLYAALVEFDLKSNASHLCISEVKKDALPCLSEIVDSTILRYLEKNSSGTPSKGAAFVTWQNPRYVPEMTIMRDDHKALSIRDVRDNIVRRARTTQITNPK